jgi:hemolysin activation/secretion protein
MINVLQTFDPAENLYGGLQYAVPVFRPDLTMSLGYSHNAFEVASGLAAGAGVDGKNLAGDTDVGFIGLSKNLHLARRSRADLGVDLVIKNAVLENLGRETEDNLTIAVLYFTTELVDRIGNGGINQLDLRYHNGIPDFLGSMDESGDGGQSTRTGGSGKAAGGDFNKITLRYQRLQRISKRNSLLFRAEAQFSDDLLTSIEQFVIGGPNSVRAYPIAEYLGDEGTFGSLEWIFQLVDKSNSSFSISAFGDFANAKLNDPLANEIADQDLSGWGVGFSYTRTGDSGNQFGFRLDIATPTSDPDPSNGDDPQYYGSMFYSFR